MKSLREKYVAAVAGASGVLAFFKWVAIGAILQLLLMLPLSPFLLVPQLLPGHPSQLVGAAVFVLGFVCLRTFLFALPCADAGARKSRGTRTAWLFGGVVLGMYALGLAAALKPKRA